MMKRILIVAAGLCAILCQAHETPRNVVLFIGDGMSAPQRMVAEEFSRKVGSGPLAMNSLPCQSMTRTYSASSLVTDSAAAATAIACGAKTNNGMLGVDPSGARLTSCAEAARDAGRKVGIVTSVTINHATPAGFYAHREHRSMLYEIGLDLIDSNFDLFMGGGLAGANSQTNSPAYAGNLYDLAASRGWMMAEGRAGFAALEADLQSGKPGINHVWYRDGEQALAYAIDAKDAVNPRLPEMTRFALDFLAAKSKDSPNGFFLMVEGGRIDWAGHANEAAANLHDLMELDDAVKVALDFQRVHPDTLVIVTGDHETGGMSMGFAGTGYAFYVERLASQKCSCEAFGERYHAVKKEKGELCSLKDDILPMVEECFGLRDFDEKTMKSLERHFKDGGFTDKVRRLVQDNAGVGWTSNSHTGLPALTTAQGPGASRFAGLLNNTDIAQIIKSFW